MINKKILMSALSIVTALSLAGGATYAFFTDTATSSNNVISSGTLSISLNDQNSGEAFVNENLGTNWAPGESKIINFDVVNTGSLPIQLRGFATGTWGSSLLDDQNKVKVTKVERWNGSGWTPILDVSTGITGLFYYTNTGVETGTFFDLATGEKAQLQLTVMLDPTAGSDFEGGTFATSITVHARQTTPSANWPL